MTLEPFTLGKRIGARCYHMSLLLVVGCLCANRLISDLKELPQVRATSATSSTPDSASGIHTATTSSRNMANTGTTGSNVSLWLGSYPCQ